MRRTRRSAARRGCSSTDGQISRGAPDEVRERYRVNPIVREVGRCFELVWLATSRPGSLSLPGSN
jgi:hypothetical protein